MVGKLDDMRDEFYELRSDVTSLRGDVHGMRNSMDRLLRIFEGVDAEDIGTRGMVAQLWADKQNRMRHLTAIYAALTALIGKLLYDLFHIGRAP